MLTIHDVVINKTGVGVRRYFQVPWMLVFVILGVAFLASVAVSFNPARSESSQPTVQPEQRVETIHGVTENPQVQTEQAITAPIVSTGIENLWVLLGTGQPTIKTAEQFGIPWKRFSFMSGSAVNEELHFPDGQAAKGRGDRDGLTFIIEAQDGSFYLTVNHGTTWHPINKVPPINDRYGNPYREIIGAYQADGRVIMYMETDHPQTEKDPFLTAYWRNEIPLDTLNGLAP